MYSSLILLDLLRRDVPLDSYILNRETEQWPNPDPLFQAFGRLSSILPAQSYFFTSSQQKRKREVNFQEKENTKAKSGQTADTS